MWDVRKNLIEVAVARSCTMKLSDESIESGWISSGAPPGNETVNNPSVFGITLAGSIRRGFSAIETYGLPRASLITDFPRSSEIAWEKLRRQAVNGFGWRDLQEWGMRQSANGRRALYPKSIMGQPLVMCSFVRDYDFAWFCMISRIIALNNCLEFVIQGFFFWDTLSIFIQFNLYTVYIYYMHFGGGGFWTWK